MERSGALCTLNTECRSLFWTLLLQVKPYLLHTFIDDVCLDDAIPWTTKSLFVDVYTDLSIDLIECFHTTGAYRYIFYFQARPGSYFR